MGCNNCGDKASLRYAPKVVVGDLDSNTKDVPLAPVRTTKTFVPDPNMPSDPRQAFAEARALSFEDIMSRNNLQLKMAASEVENMYSQMTDAMRQYHVVSLVAVSNYDNMVMPGVTPDQAIVALKSALDREDFNKINEMYPSLKEQVHKRWEELISKRIML